MKRRLEAQRLGSTQFLDESGKLLVRTDIRKDIVLFIALSNFAAFVIITPSNSSFMFPENRVVAKEVALIFLNSGENFIREMLNS